MELLIDILADAVGDTLVLVPFLFVTYLVLEALERAAGDRVNAAIRRAGAAGPVVGALLGMLPQCGFSAAGATLYGGRVITLGTLIAVFLSTSDEMLPLLVAGQVAPAEVAGILLAKAAIGMVAGLAADACLRLLRTNERAHAAVRRTVFGKPRDADAADGMDTGGERDEAAGRDLIDEFSEAGEGADHIHELCERDHCGCDGTSGPDAEEAAGHDGHSGHDHAGHTHDHVSGGRGAVVSILKSAFSHTVQVTVFIFIITLVLVAVLEGPGEAALRGFLSGNEVLTVFASALVGLIPNCAASVAVTQLYLEGLLGFGPMMAGSLAAAGTGFLVLFRTNRSQRENVAIVLVLYAVSVLSGLILLALGF